MTAILLWLSLALSATPRHCDEVFTALEARLQTSGDRSEFLDFCAELPPVDRTCLMPPAARPPPLACHEVYRRIDAGRLDQIFRQTEVRQRVWPENHKRKERVPRPQDIELNIAWCLLATTLLARIPRRRKPQDTGLPARHQLGLLVAAVVWVLVTLQWIPAGAWHANEHGFDRLAALRDGDPASVIGIVRLHGTGWLALMRPLVDWLSLPVFHVATVVLAAGALAWARVAWQLRASTHVPWFFLLGFLGVPSVLRMGPTDTLYGPLVLYAGLAVGDALRWRETGQARWLATGLSAGVLAMLTRAEFLLLMPLMILAVTLVPKPRETLRHLRRPSAIMAVVIAAACVSPRLWVLLTDQYGSTGVMRASDRDGRWGVLAHLAILGAAGLFGARSQALRRPVLLAAAFLVSIGGVLWALPVAPYDRLPLHPLFTPLHWAAPLWICLLATSWSLAVATPSRARLWGAWALISALALGIVMTTYDAVSTFLRAGLGLTPWLLLPLATWDVRRPIHGTALAGWLLGAWLLVPHPWLTHHYPKQAAWSLYQAAHELPDRWTIATLTQSDLAPELNHSLRPKLTQAQSYIGGAIPMRTISLRQLLDHPLEADTAVLLPPRCWMAVPQKKGGKILVGTELYPKKRTSFLAYEQGPMLELVAEGRDGTLAPCAEVLATFELTPLETHAVGAFSAGGTFEQLATYDATAGLYEVRRRRLAPPGDEAAPPPSTNP